MFLRDWASTTTVLADLQVGRLLLARHLRAMVRMRLLHPDRPLPWGAHKGRQGAGAGAGVGAGLGAACALSGVTSGSFRMPGSASTCLRPNAPLPSA
jgi:hypothetical protein